MPTVQLPNGKTASFPDGMSPQDIQTAIESDPNSGAAPPPSLLQRAGNFASDVGKGIGESAVSLMSTGDDAVRKIPGIGEWLTTPANGTPADQAIAHTHQLATPANTTQAVSKGIGDAAQFLIPGDAEKAAALKIADFAPKLGKLAAPIAKATTAALSSGAVNKAQGGDFGTGAAAGAVGSGIGQGLKYIAPKVAESALHVRSTDRLYGRTPGEAILQDTKGVLPSKVASTAQATINQLTPTLEAQATAAGNAGARGSLAPARNVVADLIAKNNANRAVQSASELQPVQNFLKTDQLTGQPLASAQTPMGLLGLKRGLNADFITKWKPDQPQGPLTAAKSAYSALNGEFHAAVPGSQQLDQRVSSLLPVASRANQADLNAGVLQRSLGRVGAHSGAMASGLAAGLYGYNKPGGNIKDAMLDGVLGVAAPEIATSPTTLMTGARLLNSPATGAAVRGLFGGALQAKRKGLNSQ